jgi:hypothetical protein
MEYRFRLERTKQIDKEILTYLSLLIFATTNNLKDDTAVAKSMKPIAGGIRIGY